MKRGILTAALLTTAILATPALADEAWDKQVKEEIAYFKKYAKKTRKRTPMVKRMYRPGVLMAPSTKRA